MINLLEILLFIISDVLVDLVGRYLFTKLFEKVNINTITQVLIMMNIFFLLVSFEDFYKSLPFLAILITSPFSTFRID